MVGSRWARRAVVGLYAAVLSASCGGALNDTPPEQAGASAGEGTSHGAGGEEPGPPLPEPKEDELRLGRACTSDADCGSEGLRCLGPNEDYDEGSGSPPSGICTAECNDNVGCLAFDEHAVCGTLDEAPLTGGQVAEPARRFCLLGCRLGAPSGALKCHGRQDLACRPFAPVEAASCKSQGVTCPDGTFCFRGVCRATACGPRCNSDTDCIEGRYCDPQWGLCITEIPARPAVGSECLGDAATESECGWGTCLVSFRNAGTEAEPMPVRVREMCTQSCTLGSTCGEGSGACVSPKLENFAPGDAGYCLQKCDCNADCKNGSDRCRPWGADSVKRFGSQGVCDYAFGGAPSIDCEESSGGVNDAQAGRSGND